VVLIQLCRRFGASALQAGFEIARRSGAHPRRRLTDNPISRTS
jgi:hypothetical protein